MIEAGIMDGDYVIVRQQNYAENGDTVVALIDDEATIKPSTRRMIILGYNPRIVPWSQ